MMKHYVSLGLVQVLHTLNIILSVLFAIIGIFVSGSQLGSNGGVLAFLFFSVLAAISILISRIIVEGVYAYFHTAQMVDQIARTLTAGVPTGDSGGVTYNEAVPEGIADWPVVNSDHRSTIPSSQSTCFHCGGIDEHSIACYSRGQLGRICVHHDMIELQHGCAVCFEKLGFFANKLSFRVVQDGTIYTLYAHEPCEQNMITALKDDAVGQAIEKLHRL